MSDAIPPVPPLKWVVNAHGSHRGYARTRRVGYVHRDLIGRGAPQTWSPGLTLDELVKFQPCPDEKSARAAVEAAWAVWWKDVHGNG